MGLAFSFPEQILLLFETRRPFLRRERRVGVELLAQTSPRLAPKLVFHIEANPEMKSLSSLGAAEADSHRGCDIRWVSGGLVEFESFFDFFTQPEMKLGRGRLWWQGVAWHRTSILAGLP